MSRVKWIRVTWALSFLALALTLLVAVEVLRTPAASNFLPTALTAFVVLLVVFLVGIFVRRVDFELSRGFAWLVGAMSLAVSLIPLWVLSSGNTDTAGALYRGLRIPQGIERFWDAALVLRSIDCSALGVDVFAAHNGCLQDPAIYGPGMLWLKYVPFGLFSFTHVLPIGIAMMVISSLALVWLVRQSSGIGQIALLIAALGAPWLLLLERGNIDAVLIWVAVISVIIVRRWPNLISWSVVAVMIWLVGTWKYYPFAMGLMLIPVLLLRRGWIVFAAWFVASTGFVVITWSNFKFSMQSNSNMIDVSDSWVLGRVPVVARMLGSAFPSSGIQSGDIIVGLLALAALRWGVVLGLRVVPRSAHVNLSKPMLAIAGSSLFLASVLIGGFGWAYKAAFLLLCIPLIAWLCTRFDRIVVFTGVVALALVAIGSVVVWNTLLATLAGILSSSVAFGVSASLIYIAIRGSRISPVTSINR